MEKIKSLPKDYNVASMKEEFEESYKILCAVNAPFYENMKKIFEIKEMNVNKFVERTHLHKRFYKDFTKEGYIPRMDTFISMCMGLNLDLATAESLLASMRLGFDKTDRRHCAYMFLLTRYQGLGIEDCNGILRDLGYNEEKYLLGTFTKEDRE